MRINIKSTFVKVVSFILILTLMTPCSAIAATSVEIQPCASNYLTAYNTYICNVSGDIQIWYEVAGKGTMDEIGVLTIDLYEVTSSGSLSYVTSFLHEDYDTMLIKNDNYIYSYVSYQGSSSKTYKAYVCIWAGKNGSGDTRYMWATE